MGALDRRDVMLINEDTGKYKGKVLSHFEDEHGNEINDLYMIECLVIVFSDNSKIKMSQDWRGNECYFSQYEAT